MQNQLQNGDMVEVQGPWLFPRHVGIYAAGRGFVHNSKANKRVELTNLFGFSGGYPLRVLWRVAGTPFEQEQAVQRAFALMGRPYDLLNFNCEHAAYAAQTGTARSPQLGFAFAMLLLSGIGLWAWAKAK